MGACRLRPKDLADGHLGANSVLRHLGAPQGWSNALASRFRSVGDARIAPMIYRIFASRRDASRAGVGGAGRRRNVRAGGFCGDALRRRRRCLAHSRSWSGCPARRLSPPRPLPPPSRRLAAMPLRKSAPVARCSRIARSRFELTGGANTRPTRSSTGCRCGCLSTPAQATSSSPLRPPPGWGSPARTAAGARSRPPTASRARRRRF